MNGAWPRFLRRLSASVIRPNVVRGTAPGSRSASTSGLAVSNSPVVSLTLYPPSVMVSEMMRVAGAAIFSMTASGSSGANRYCTIDPMIRGSQVPSPCLRTSVYRPSCASRTCFIRWSAGMTPTPQMPQSSAVPWFIRRSWYMAWCARWKPPTPTWTTPGVTRLRS